MFRFKVIAILFLLAIQITSAVSHADDLYGMVRDKQSREPIVGAVVSIKGTKTGTLTDINGEYRITGIELDSFTAVFQMVGYQSKEIATAPGELNVELMISFINVGETVTTGTATEQIFQDVPVKTEVVTRRQIEIMQEPDLAGLLSYTSGLRVENNCQNCSFTQLRMLGLEGGYSQILIDGDPMVSTMAGVYGLQQFPQQMIDQIEIVKGGGSSLYGGNAIGGVVNIKLREPTSNRSNFSYNYKVGDSHVRSELGFMSELVTDDNKTGLYVFGNTREQNGYDNNDDGYTDIGQLKAETFGINYITRPSENDFVTANVHRIHEDRRGGNRLSYPSHDADISEAAESYRWGGKLKYERIVSETITADMSYSFALAERNTYYGAGRDPNAYGRTDNPTHLLRSKVYFDLGSNTLITGVDYKWESLYDEAIAYSRVIDDDYTNGAFYIQDELALGDRYTIVGGARVDKHSLLDDPIVSPRISGLFKLTDELKLRANISTGFKAPQVFDEDLHITQVGGEGQIHRNSNNLKKEKSISYSGTIDYMGFVGNSLIQAGLTGFITNLDDQFQIVERDDPNTPAAEFLRINGDGLTVAGIELQAGYKPFNDLEIHGNFTIQNDELDSPEEDFGSTRLFKTPEHYGNLAIYYDLLHIFSVFAGFNYTGEMKIPHYAGYISDDVLETTDPFVTFDLGLSYKWSKKSDSNITKNINIGIKNVFDEYQPDLDKGMDRDAGYIYGPANPRLFYAGLEFGLL